MLTIIFAIDGANAEVQDVVSKLKVKNRIEGEDNVFYYEIDKSNPLSCRKDKGDDSEEDGTVPDTIESVKTGIMKCIAESKEEKLQILFVSHNTAKSDYIAGTIERKTVFEFFTEICETFAGDKEITIKCYACQFFDQINYYFTRERKLKLAEEELEKIHIFASQEYLTPNPFFSKAIIESREVSDKSAKEEYLATLPVIPSSYYPSAPNHFEQYFPLEEILSCFRAITVKAGHEINTNSRKIECKDGQIILPVVKKLNEKTLSRIKECCFNPELMKKALDESRITEQRDLIKKILQTATYTDGVNVKGGRFYFTLGEEILSEKFQWKFFGEPESQPIESERDFIEELTLPAISLPAISLPAI